MKIQRTAAAEEEWFVGRSAALRGAPRAARGDGASNNQLGEIRPCTQTRGTDLGHRGRFLYRPAPPPHFGVSCGVLELLTRSLSALCGW